MTRWRGSFVVVVWVAALGVRAEPLKGTAALTAEGDPAMQMVEGIDRFLLRETAEAMGKRERYWKRDASSAEKYQASVEPNRQRLAKMLGVVDAREAFDSPELLATTKRAALVGRGAAFEAYAVRWPVMGAIHGEGLLLVPMWKEAVADVVAIPDADQTPEMIAGLMPGVAAESQFARRLAESGCRVIVPALVDRSDTYSMPPSGQRTNQPHREYVYRPAFEMGRHVIGYEIQKVLAAVDWFEREKSGRRIGVFGYGEGGMLALYSGAIDTRIGAVAVSGYFGSRQDLWQEPIYRNVFGLLREFGDAEVASLVKGALVVEACRAPEAAGPPPPHDKRMGAAPGRLVTPALAEVKAEVARVAAPARCGLVVSGDDGRGAFGSMQALGAILQQAPAPESAAATVEPAWKDYDPQPRLKRQIDEMQEHTQQLVRKSDAVRNAYWAKADHSSLEKWQQTVPPYREAYEKELIGKIERETLPANARTRQIFDEPKYVGYEVMLDVFPDVFASGILLVPKGIAPGERRPVVVCQHGLEGRPRNLADSSVDNHFYHRVACRLAERGFVAYAPQNPYVGQDKFRTLQRKANPLGLTLFSFIVPQHRQTTDWLASLPFVDPQRIAFYGLSYGGKTAMRVPAVVERYCLSICSGDFNEWVWKCTSLTYASGYPGTGEYEMFEWNLGNTFNYAETAGLIAPRPFMVERGHRDGVAPDEWVAYEYAKVRRLYAELKIPERTTIEFFDGPHMINGVGTFKFLHEKLNWPEPQGDKP